jgi:hypothetical protein
MNHLTNLYKHKCEQLQEQINNIKRMLNEAEAPPVNDPDYPEPEQLPDGRWISPKPSWLPDDWFPRWYGPQPPQPTYIFNPADPSNPPTIQEWLDQHPRPTQEPGMSDQEYRELLEEWTKAANKALAWYKEQWYRNRDRDRYRGPGALDRVGEDIIEDLPDWMNPFGS